MLRQPRSRFRLALEPGWQELLKLNQRSLAQNQGQSSSVVLDAGWHRAAIHARTHPRCRPPTKTLVRAAVCDVRAGPARGRGAHAHREAGQHGPHVECGGTRNRNPLAAIVAGRTPCSTKPCGCVTKPLIRMVQQNANRLERIVDEVLNIARVRQRGPQGGSFACGRTAWWRRPALTGISMVGVMRPCRCSCEDGTSEVAFEAEHLRRVLINLLDNANRYAGPAVRRSRSLTSNPWRAERR